MAATSHSSSLVLVQPAFTDAERLALAGYRGLTREAYIPDLRQFAGWCRARSLPAVLGAPRRHQDLRPRTGSPRPGPPTAVHHRRLLQVRRRGGTPGAFPGRARPPAEAGLRVAQHRPGPAARSARSWSPPGSARPPSTRFQADLDPARGCRSARRGCRGAFRPARARQGRAVSAPRDRAGGGPAWTWPVSRRATVGGEPGRGHRRQSRLRTPGEGGAGSGNAGGRCPGATASWSGTGCAQRRIREC